MLAQTFRDFELCIVSDGAPPETLACARALAAEDARIQVFDFPKGERHGEAHRHTVLQQAAGQFVAQIADDDLWFPNHLMELGRLLQQVDFGNLPQVLIMPDGFGRVTFTNLFDAAVREEQLTKIRNVVGPSFTGYRMSAYRALPEGWTPAPQPLPTDLHMWRKFLSHPDLKTGTRLAITGVHMPTAQRQEMPLEARLEETRRVVERFAHPAARDRLAQNTLFALSGSTPPFEDQPA